MEKVMTSLPAPDTAAEGGTAVHPEQQGQQATTGTEKENPSSTQTMIQQMNNHNNPENNNNNNNNNIDNNDIEGVDVGGGVGGNDNKEIINNNLNINNNTNTNTNNKNNDICDPLSSGPIRVAETAGSGSEQQHHANNNNNNNNGVVVDMNMNMTAQTAQAQAQERSRSLSVTSLGSFSMGDEDGSDLLGDLGVGTNTSTSTSTNNNNNNNININTTTGNINQNNQDIIGVVNNNELQQGQRSDDNVIVSASNSDSNINISNNNNNSGNSYYTSENNNSNNNIVHQQKEMISDINNSDGQHNQQVVVATTNHQFQNQHEEQNQLKDVSPSPNPPLSSSTTNFNENNNNNNNNNTNDNTQLHQIKSSLLAVESMQYEQQQSQSKEGTPATVTQQQSQSQEVQQRPQQGINIDNNNNDVIELLDDDEGDTDVQVIDNPQHVSSSATTGNAGVKRLRPPETNSNTTITPGSTMHGYQQHQQQQNNYNHGRNHQSQSAHHHHQQQQQQQRKKIKPNRATDPRYMPFPQTHTPTWDNPLPPIPRLSGQNSNNRGGSNNQMKHFELSLLNLSEFTITGLPVTMDGRPSSVLGFRKIIKEVSRGHGKAVFERDDSAKVQQNNNNNNNNNSNYSSYMDNNENDESNSSVNWDGGKWRIPLGAYRAFYSYLRNDNLCKVRGIPEEQLKIASLGKARIEKGFPSANKIVSLGVPKGLATALAPFQRGGVDFVVEKEGRALLADDMGLGKTIQAIASMSVYHDEWPLLILTPSSARYHWECEFQQWLGLDSTVNNKKEGDQKLDIGAIDEGKEDPCEEEEISIENIRNPMRLLQDSEIHVVVTGKAKLFPSKKTRIVICSYGLATSLVESGKIYAGLFKCAIVDESHMLKNIKTKRTSKLVPILHATSRCLLLSGTPALARPTELWPQLKILSTERDGWWDDEGEFVRKYVQRTSAIRRAELHTMLTGTVMIRRMKHNILKSLPSKRREKAIVDVVTDSMRGELHKCMKLLREGKGVLAKIAKKQEIADVSPPVQAGIFTSEALKAEYNERYRERLYSLSNGVLTSQVLNEEEKKNTMEIASNRAKEEVDVWYKERVRELQNGLQEPEEEEEEELDRKTILNRMYSLTAKAKIPMIAECVEKWLADPTKGKLCIFAHHIFVLDEIIKLAGLSNRQGSSKRFIRIDGSTAPKERQAQIKAFQTDPTLRVAVLGITAAGVAVTLTASSTVWFTELFWTPALMIQAEDRCHRIGQNAVVKCLYFVATGTLDVLLWDLLEKKFRDLGEFVEGKEKMNIVVHHTYKSIKEVESIFTRSDDDDDDDDEKLGDNETAAEDDLIKLENDLQDDIVQLANEEMVMISTSQEGDDEDGPDNGIIGKPAYTKNLAQAKPVAGQTEDEAICLSDDDDDDDTSSNHKENTKASSSAAAVTKENHAYINYNVMNRKLNNVRYYSQYFEGSSFGIQLVLVNNRLVVANEGRVKTKPALGDVLIAVNGHRLPLSCPLDNACRFMKECLSKGTVELTFVEDEGFTKFCVRPVTEARAQFHAANNIANNKKPRNDPPTSSGGVIEILDDDD